MDWRCVAVPLTWTRDVCVYSNTIGCLTLPGVFVQESMAGEVWNRVNIPFPSAVSSVRVHFGSTTGTTCSDANKLNECQHCHVTSGLKLCVFAAHVGESLICPQRCCCALSPRCDLWVFVAVLQMKWWKTCGLKTRRCCSWCGARFSKRRCESCMSWCTTSTTAPEAARRSKA